MGIGKFFKALVGGQPPGQKSVSQQANFYAQYQQQNFKGKLASSFRRVSVVTPSNEIKLHLSTALKPVVVREDYVYDDSGDTSLATGSQVVIIDATSKAYARYHDQYDKILRIKKSMGKTQDIYCAFGKREDYKKYPRGTYPNMWFFCFNPENLEHREPDLPPEGMDTVEGPRLYSFADLPEAVSRKIRPSKL